MTDRTEGRIALLWLVVMVAWGIVFTLLGTVAHAEGQAKDVKLADVTPGVSIGTATAKVVLGQVADPPVNDWKWRLEPCLGAGTTLAKGFNATVSFGAVLGTFPPGTPILGGHDFGAVYCQVNGEPGGGPFVNVVGPLDLALLVWRGQRVEGDVALMMRKSWSF